MAKYICEEHGELDKDCYTTSLEIDDNFQEYKHLEGKFCTLCIFKKIHEVFKPLIAIEDTQNNGN